MEPENNPVDDSTNEEVTISTEVETHHVNPANDSNEDTTPDQGEKSERDKYISELRAEAKKYRLRAKDRDAVAHRLHTELVRGTGRLVDPSDLPFRDEHLADTDAMTEAIDELLRRKPHLGKRTPASSPGQGITNKTEGVSILGMMRKSI